MERMAALRDRPWAGVTCGLAGERGLPTKDLPSAIPSFLCREFEDINYSSFHLDMW